MGEVPVRIGRRAFLAGALATATSCGLRPELAVPPPASDFGDEIAVDISEMEAVFASGERFHYVPQGRMWVVEVPDDQRDLLKAVTDDVLHPSIDAGYAALFQTCPHLGCRVPQCSSSGEFECPCHGSTYGRLGEHRGGPAPRGLDRFPARVEDGLLLVDTGTVVEGLPLGTILGLEADGPSCLSSEDEGDRDY